MGEENGANGGAVHFNMRRRRCSQLEGNVWSGGVTLLDAQTSEQLCELQLETGVAALAWCSSDGNVLALGCDDGDVRLAKLSADEALIFKPLSGSNDDKDTVTDWGHDDVITDVSSSITEKTHLATCSWDLTVKLWDVTVMDQTIATFHGHTDLIWGVAMNPTHKHVLCSASQDSTVQVWDARQSQGAALSILTLSPALSVDWHPRQPVIFSVGLDDGRVCTYDVRSPHMPLAQHDTHTAAVHVVRYSPYHDDVLATGGDDGKAFVTESCSKNDCNAREVLGGDNLSAHRDYVRAFDWCQLMSSSLTSQTDTILFTGSWDKTVHKWNIDDYFCDEQVLDTTSGKQSLNN
ncbi:Polyadenylation factor I complex, subunit PFS2 [Plasmopara halstedii]|uniref:Peroxin-7 n=1 Tax=Plasmopara halstedii TaxID=4781 RepID=A0A0P1AH59_PLAHL|nr:Polyadenylation factor I complex, subunit PFS2 [Plasmopara halstedii]CEG40220.1 Polyadenylation factor I complex, subunit PFS2 [Plasmopara halstedii]|eukprot:XP_024576589.1 Polyadenylation factor I complex, subunit PFS2 [Plasmopara halstedii]